MRLFFMNLLVLGVTFAGHGAAAAPDMIPHIAVYHLKLSEVRSPTDITAAEGLTYYSFVKTCDGWTVENQSSLALTNQNGDTSNTFWRFSTFEAADGSSYLFDSRQSADQVVVEKVAGKATIAGENPGIVELTSPNTDTLELPAGVLFPTAHLQAAIRAAESGQRVFGAATFDGASLDNPYFVNTLVLGSNAPAKPAATGGADFPSLASWNLRLAYYPLDPAAEQPDFEMDLTYRADGVATALTQTFDGFSLKGTLERIMITPPPDC
ncbi:MAG: EipB family protein [Magnetospiraceae bacterium]